MEILTYNENKFKEFFDDSQQYMKDCFYIFSLGLEIKDEKNIDIIKNFYEHIKALFNGLPFIKSNPNKYQLNFGYVKKKIFFDLVSMDNNLIQMWIEFGFDLSKFVEFQLILKSGIDMTQFLSRNNKQIFIDICSIFFSLKSKCRFKHIIPSLFEAFKAVNYSNKKLISILKFIFSFIGTKMKLELNSEIYSKEKKEEKIKYFSGLFDWSMNISYFYLSALNMFEAFKETNFDNISLSLGLPKNKNGISVILKIREISNVMLEYMEKNYKY